MRSASQLQGMRERTSDRPRGRSDIGMSVAHICITDGITAGKEARARDNRKQERKRRMGPGMAHRRRANQITITRRHSSTHKQATDTPPSGGVFLPGAKARTILSERLRGDKCKIAALERWRARQQQRRA